MGLSQALDSYFENAMLGVHTALPATVVKYTAETHRAQVKPSIPLLMGNGVQVELPDLLDVPVSFPSAKSFDLEFPLAKGDPVMLVFQEQDIAGWKAGDAEPRSAAASRFNLDGAVALPGLFSRPSAGRVRLVVGNDGTLTLTAKKIVFKGQTIFEDEVIGRKDFFVGVGVGPGVSLKEHVHGSAAGPTNPPNPITPIPPEENNAPQP